ncbi:MAG: Glutathione S-transferase [Betaproteobacteria bacterium]|nr:Glutathione S-transferase [Betaproteobacteria bacterium]
MLKLWGRPTSGRTQKVLWTLSEIGLDFDFIMASGEMGPGGHVSKGNQPYGLVNTVEYRAKNPNGRVPTIDDDGFVLWESNSIVRYLAMQYAPDLLYGNGIKTFASASRWVDWENNELLPPQHNMAMHLIRLPEDQRDPEILAAACEKFDRAMKIADDQLGRTPYIAGDRFTYGDIPLGVRVHRWHVLGLAKQTPPNIARWYEAIKARPGFQVWTAEPSYHLEG